MVAWVVCKWSCGCHSFTVLNGKGWYFSSQAPTHPVSKDRHQAHFLSLFLSLWMWPTVNGKTQCLVVLETFSVARQKSTIMLASSLSFCSIPSLIFAAAGKQGSVTRLTGVFFDIEHRKRMNCHFTRKQRERKPTCLLSLRAQTFQRLTAQSDVRSLHSLSI